MKFILPLILCFVITTISTASDKIVCYFGSWSVYRKGDNKFSIDNINTNLCTHLLYSFVGINTDGSIRLMDPYNDITLGSFSKFNNLRQQNPILKTMVAIGGWSEGSTNFSTVVNSSSLREAFLSSSVSFLQTYGFDGLDIDWEYPGQRGGASTDKNNFVTLLAEFRPVFDAYGYLLTAAVAAQESAVTISYDVSQLSQYLDFINVMTYDLHGLWDEKTGHSSPLYNSSTDITAYQRSFTVEACITNWISKGADPQKLILGMPIYGNIYTLANSSNTGVSSPTTGGETLPYYDICQELAEGDWTLVWDEEQMVPYAYRGDQWMGYDNPRSIALKVDFAKRYGLGGIMIWSIDQDDFGGKCGIVNPILTTINLINN